MTCPSLLVDTQADHMSLLSHMPQGASFLLVHSNGPGLELALGIFMEEKVGTVHVYLSVFDYFLGQPTQLAGS